MSELENVHYGILDVAWKAVQQGYVECHKKYASLVFHANRDEEFFKCFSELYEDIMRRFMKEGTTELDTHKQAAILTISCLKANVIEYTLDDSEHISIIPQMIAVNVGLSYMKDCMNDILRRKKIGKHIDKYYLPIAIACGTPYQEIMCRILYHEQNESDMSFNVLELSDRYFLIEYINLLQRGIEPYLLKES